MVFASRKLHLNSPRIQDSMWIYMFACTSACSSSSSLLLNLVPFDRWKCEDTAFGTIKILRCILSLKAYYLYIFNCILLFFNSVMVMLNSVNIHGQIENENCAGAEAKIVLWSGSRESRHKTQENWFNRFQHLKTFCWNT